MTTSQLSLVRTVTLRYGGAMENNSIEIDGLALKRVLRRARLSANDLAERMGKHAQTIYRLQQGRGNTTMTFLDELAEHLGRDIVAGLITHDEDREDFLARLITNGNGAV